MQAYAWAKINWSLAILGRRGDGYHLLDTLMQTVSLADTISAIEADTLTLTVDGLAPTGNADDNLVMRAARLLRDACGVRAGAHIELVKRIPAQAGLGGGSADAAATLRLLCALWRLDLDDGALAALALRLGADVPFLLRGGLSRVRGIGEAITPLPERPRMHLVLLQPEAGLSTPAVFGAYDALPSPAPNPDMDAVEAALRAGDVAALSGAIGNALTDAAISQNTQVGDCLAALRQAGAHAAWMTGSGSATVGLFPSLTQARHAAALLQAHWPKCWCAHSH